MSSLPDISDAELIGRVVAQRDQAALVALHRRYEGCVRGVVLAAIPSDLKAHIDVEDCNQELFLTLLDGLKTFDRARPFEPYVVRVAQNVVRELVRSMTRAKRDVTRIEAGPDGSDFLAELSATLTSPSQVVGRNEAIELVRGKLAELRRIDREALDLKYFQEADDAVAAASLGVSRTAYLMRVLRARETLRAKLLPHLRASWFEGR